MSLKLFYRVAILAAVNILFTVASMHAANTIDFRNDGTLKAVYDAGLRPWLSSSSNDRCSIGESNLNIILPGDKRISGFPAEHGSFQVLADYALVNAEFASGLIGLSDATALAQRIATELGLPTDGITRLAAQASPTTVSSPRDWTGEIKAEGLQLFVRFTPVPRFSEIKGKVAISLEWNRPMTGMRFWEQRMTPPPGYEKEDMERPAPTPREGRQVPDPGPEYYEALLEAQRGPRPTPGEAPSTTTTPSSQRLTEAASPSPTDTPAVVVEESASRSFPVVLVCVIVVIIAGVVTFLIRRR